MKLYLAAAVLMLVLAVHTAEAQEEPTLEQHFTKFGTQMKEIAEDLADKTKTAFQNIEQSELGTKTRNWFNDQYEKLKQKMTETFN
ncbi:apolipoprotein C-I isoform 1 precursor [Danio rerio]|uniref:Apolipoprotein C-I n=1 Tax=Danio rerio TaxID=7955 RepID=E9QDI1_DANRE|nr:apolipoprotein C-I isoform 1 precursor [Danio rerio]|eukprot:NP_001278815.1 apolipoprotein C-I isoform 1 precursor [Danio rerio]